MEIIFYTLAALILYGVSDYILNTIEIRMGKRLDNRSLIFFVIISMLAVSSFAILQTILQKPDPGMEPALSTQPQVLAPKHPEPGTDQQKAHPKTAEPSSTTAED